MNTIHKRIMAALVFELLLLCTPAHARSRADEAEISRIEGIFMNARSGQEMVPYLDPEATFIWDVSLAPQYGVAAVSRHIDEILATPEFKRIKLTLVKMEVEANNEIGFANSIQHLTMFDDAGQVLMDSDFRLTNTYHKRHGRWYCVGEHNSFPIDFSTGKAVFGKIPLH